MNSQREKDPEYSLDVLDPCPWMFPVPSPESQEFPGKGGDLVGIFVGKFFVPDLPKFCCDPVFFLEGDFCLVWVFFFPFFLGGFVGIFFLPRSLFPREWGIFQVGQGWDLSPSPRRGFSRISCGCGSPFSRCSPAVLPLFSQFFPGVFPVFFPPPPLGAKRSVPLCPL